MVTGEDPASHSAQRRLVQDSVELLDPRQAWDNNYEAREGNRLSGERGFDRNRSALRSSADQQRAGVGGLFAQPLQRPINLLEREGPIEPARSFPGIDLRGLEHSDAQTEEAADSHLRAVSRAFPAAI